MFEAHEEYSFMDYRTSSKYGEHVVRVFRDLSVMSFALFLDDSSPVAFAMNIEVLSECVIDAKRRFEGLKE